MKIRWGNVDIMLGDMKMLTSLSNLYT